MGSDKKRPVVLSPSSGHALDEDFYFKELARLQRHLARIQQAYFLGGQRAVIVIEGVDAAGKGGLIRRITWALDPRGFQVWPIAGPNQVEQGEYYLQRFWRRLPVAGKIAIFDRSWYGRVLVERVEGFANRDQWRRASNEINHLESGLVDDGIRVAKVLLEISSGEQLRRFRERLESPQKRWKLSFEDFRNRRHQRGYRRAFADMLGNTSTKKSPWHVVASDDKKWSRIAAMKVIIEVLGEGIDLRPPKISPELRREAARLFGGKN